MLLLIIIISLFILYSLLLLYYAWAWKQIPFFQPPVIKNYPKLSVIIPARNEEQNIDVLLKALQEQDYPASHVEIIVVDDNSTDRTADIVKGFKEVKLLQLTGTLKNAHKKKAIEMGIDSAAHDWIITTDADCIPGPAWLSSIAGMIEIKDPVFIAGPVKMRSGSSLVGFFQQMDFMILQAITGAVVSKNILSMCNGANLCYSKKAFYEVNGFSGIDHISSGDDMLLMYKIAKRFPGRIAYIKSPLSIVETIPMRSWLDFIYQRIRWASKAGAYQDKRFFPVLLLVYLLNVCFPVLLAYAIIHPATWYWLPALWLAKTAVEFPLYFNAARFFNIKVNVLAFLIFQPLHILYIIISGAFGQFGSYEWKGRKVR